MAIIWNPLTGNFDTQRGLGFLDDRYLNEDANLSDLADVPTARTNLGVLSSDDAICYSLML